MYEFCSYFRMSAEIPYNVILSDHVFFQIKVVQQLLSQRDEKNWSFSKTFNLLLRFGFDSIEKINDKDLRFMRSYFAGRESYIKEITSKAIMSLHKFEDYNK